MTQQPTLRRHPIRGFLWGLMAGLGVTLLLMVLSIIPLSIPTLSIGAGTAAVLGALWGSFGPPKAGSAPPAPDTSTAHEPATPSGADDPPGNPDEPGAPGPR